MVAYHNPHKPEHVLPLLDYTRVNWPFASRGIEPVVEVPMTFDYLVVPSDRPLHAILADVVQHGVDNPRHGADCACMDRFVYEIRAHVSRVLPEIVRVPAEDWDGTVYMAEEATSREANWDAKTRISGVLQMVTRNV